MIDITKTKKKVDKALDLRFEKDTTLYISKDETEKIKELLDKNRYQQLEAMTKKLGTKIVAKVILKNSWLINTLRKDYKNYLLSLFNSLEDNYFIAISKDIIEDNIYSSLEFKNFIEEIYINKIDVKSCENVYKNKNEILDNRFKAFSRYLKEDYILNNKESTLVRYIDKEFRNYPEIYNFIQNKNINFLVSVFSKVEDKKYISDWILEEQIDNKNDKIWKNALSSFGDVAFDCIINYINDKEQINPQLIRKVLARFYKLDNFENEIINFYQSVKRVRTLLIDMLSNIKDKDIQKEILIKFKNIGIPDKVSQSDLDNILEDNKRSKFKDINEILDYINNNTLTINTLPYLSFKLTNKLAKDLYSEYNQNSNIN